MAKIIKIDSGIVTVVKNDGELIQVPDHTLSFVPILDQQVEVYEDNGSYIINRSQKNSTYNVDGLVNKVTYALLAIFLGGLGAHKFYSGKTGMGIVYLIFCWTFIPAIIGLIEGIISLSKPEIEPGMISV